MKKRIFIAVAATACAAACIGGFSACGGEREPEHRHDYAITHVEATCAEGGYALHSCACGHSYKEYDSDVNPDNHNFVEHDEKAPTCTEIGWVVYQTCSLCDYTTYYELEAFGHRWDEGEITVSSTCTAKGVKTFRCENYGCEEVKEEELGFSEHVWDEGKITVEPTCFDEGVKSFKCTNKECTATKDEEIPAAGHSFDEVWKNNATHHWREAVCEHTEEIDGYAEHDWEDNVCAVCDYEVEGSKGLRYRLNSENDAYVLSGRGTCEDKDIIIPSVYNGKPVVTIGGSALAGTDIKSVVIPDGVRNIVKSAFENCRNLRVAVIPKSVTEIEDWAFSGCYKLVEVYNLSSLDIKKGELSHGRAGYNAINIFTSLNEESRITYTQDGFMFCNDGENYFLFGYEGDKTVLTLPSDIGGNSYGINSYAFIYSYENLKEVTIPDKVTSIGESAFQSCGLTKINIGKGITEIPSMAFCGCSQLMSIVIPENITKIDGYWAFEGCYNLVEVYNLSSLKIEKGSEQNGSVALYAINVYNSLENESKVTETADGYLLCDDEYYNSYLFDYNGTETKLVVSEDFERIHKYAFYGLIDVTDITILTEVEQIHEFAFGNCGLTSVALPASVKYIGDYAFKDCRKLTSINFNGTKEQWNAIQKGKGWDDRTGDYTIHCTDGDIAKSA